MITKRQYVEYLICTIGNFTSTNLADHLDDVSHDTITDYLQSERLTPRGVWELVASLIQDSSEAFMLVDDSVQDKRYSHFIELVKTVQPADIFTVRASFTTEAGRFASILAHHGSLPFRSPRVAPQRAAGATAARSA